MLDTLREKLTVKKRRPLGAVTELGWRARTGATGPGPNDRTRVPVAPGYPVVDGPHYLDVLEALHPIRRPDWYLEIGTCFGASLIRCPGKFVAIDPTFQFDQFGMGQAGQGHLFQQTSDDFFASGFLARNGIAPDLGFLDGMHLAEYLARDFAAFEAAAAPGAMAVLHDCLPQNPVMEARDWDPATRWWTGDVWKVLAGLIETRPDLRITVLDCYPTGLVLVEGLAPGQDHAPLHDFVARHAGTRLSEYGPDRYFGAFEIESAFTYIQRAKAA